MRVYLDHSATSPLRPEVMEAMRPWLGAPANPASAHALGRAAAAAVERAREQVAALVGGRPDGVVFTSGATEANHQAIAGAAALREGRVWVSAVEHPCVQAAAARLAEHGREVGLLPVGEDGVVRLERQPGGVVALLAVQHETGVVQPLEQLRAWREAGADLSPLEAPRPRLLRPDGGARTPWVHVDATQAAGRIALSLGWADSVALSAHKIGGPAGIGALVLRDGEAFPALFPGVQERARRGGTVNVAGAVGFGAACVLAACEVGYGRGLQASLEAGLTGLGARIIGADAPRVGSTTMAVFPGLRGDAIVAALDLRGVCVSAGAACASGSLRPSPTLLAMGDPEPAGGVRFSLGPQTTEAEILRAIEALRAALSGLRSEGDLADWLGEG
jgi:cysteine desulfurase